MKKPQKAVVVLLDSLNRHMLGSYGGYEFETPNLDRFAKRAISFTNHYTGSLPCIPARHDGNKGLMGMMSLLPTEQKHVIELKFFQHFTFDEIAGQLGISSNTAKSRLYAALKKMREQNENVMMVKEGA